jgi:folate-binding protein YgfZ
MRLETGTPLYGVDFDDDNLPQEVGRNEQAISFTKGCYLGQETVARIDALGHVNQQLVGVRFDGEAIPTVGTELTSGGAVAGRVTSATYSPLLEAPLAIAMVRHKFLPTGTRLDSANGPCEIVSMPIQTSQG